MIGVPGSGKSTEASNIAEKHRSRGYSTSIHSTDSYFVGEDGVYRFDINNLHENHERNMNAFEQSCKDGIDCVICDNTNIWKRNREPYARIAEKYGYGLFYITVGDFDTKDHLREYHARNTHGVPFEVIEKMWENYQTNRVHL